MDPAAAWGWSAAAVLAVHVALVLFVVGALPLVLIGNLWARWPWVNGFAFRFAHLAAIGTVVAEAWLGIACPLTTLEMNLRRRAQGSSYEGGFIEHWLTSLLYHEAPPWVFTAAYSAFGLLVLATWWGFPPRRHPVQPQRSRITRADPRAGAPGSSLSERR